MGRVPLLFWPLAIIRRTTINQLVGFRSMIIQFSLIYRYIVLTFIEFSGKRSFRLNHVSSASVRIFFSLLNQVSIFFLKKVILLFFWCFIYYKWAYMLFFKIFWGKFFQSYSKFHGDTEFFQKIFCIFWKYLQQTKYWNDLFYLYHL